MASLRRELRRDLEKAVIAARVAGEKGARKAIEALAVQNGKPWPTMGEEQKKLRNRLRAHGKQLGDLRNQRNDEQSIEHLVQECAYEHWHRMLFARFLAESGLLIEPGSGVAISLEECKELAEEDKRRRKEMATTAQEKAEADRINFLTLAGRYAQTMLPEIFRADDPVLLVSLAREDQLKLEELLEGLEQDTFTASDSLGWCYQFWQAERKDQVNASGNKIGADELPSVTQLFTEDYMVDFLLDNTLGAWSAGKQLTLNPQLSTLDSEDELRQAVALQASPWKYLRFIKDNDGKWTPAAGTFDGWPKTAKELKCLDPCMGSGHFVVAMFERLVALRLAEENLGEAAAVAAVIRDNLFGLEIDPRCTQIGAFNLALAAWRRVGHSKLPAMNLACSGLAPNAGREEWMKLTDEAQHLRFQMGALYDLFGKAPVLGSLINPSIDKAVTYGDALHQLQPLLEKALAQETKDETTHEMAVTARGLAKAAEILAGKFTLVATNVPYLKTGKQHEDLKAFCSTHHASAKAELATCFVERCLEFCSPNGVATLVTPQSWLFQPAYKTLRPEMLTQRSWLALAKLGPGAFETISGEVVNVCLVMFGESSPKADSSFSGWDATTVEGANAKAEYLRVGEIVEVGQRRQLTNPEARIVLGNSEEQILLSVYSKSHKGITSNDDPLFLRNFWESHTLLPGWAFHQSTVEDNSDFGGREHVLWYEEGTGRLRSLSASQDRDRRRDMQGVNAWGRRGVAVSCMGSLPVTFYGGEKFDTNVAAIIPEKAEYLPAIWCFCTSPQFAEKIRTIDHALKVTNATLVKIPFDLAHWQKVAAEKYPHGLPKPFSSDPTQWVFNGHPAGADQPLHVAVARLLGYQWPRQTGSSFPDCPALGPDGLERLADDGGIVCLDALQGELSATERLRALLAEAYGSEWSPAKQAELMAQVGAATLDQWLREKFFEQHCALFHNRPFIWHIWDGMAKGFHALVNYHRLVAPNGEGRRTLEKLIYTYLGDWIRRQRDDQKNGVEGSDARVAAAEHLKKQLDQILHGEPPYDIFVRWKAVHEQPVGWEPDINDGVRLNIRPFMMAPPFKVRGKRACILRVTPKIKWEKDRGKEPLREKQDFPWFWSWDQSANADFEGGQMFDGNRWNDLHYTTKFKQASRERNSAKKVQ